MNKLRINRLGVLSVAKLQGVMGLVIGLLYGIIFALLIVIQTIFGASFARGNAAFAIGGGGIVLAIIVLIALPLFFGITCFIGGAISALLYNLFAGFVGGTEIEVENIL